MNKLHSPESLRGIACIAVVFSHLFGVFFPQLHNFYESSLPKYEIAESIYNSPFTFFYSGTGAVFVFFALSGYVLTLSSLKAKESVKRFWESVIKRYPRLAIPAIGSCLFMYLALHINIDVSRTSEWFQTVKLANYSLFDALYTGAIGAFAFGSQKYNPALWTMRIELIGSFVIYFACLLQVKPMFKHLFLLLIAIVSFKLSLVPMLGILSFIVGHYFYFYKKSLPESLSIIIFIIGLYLCGAHNSSQSYVLFSNLLGEKTYDILNFVGGFLIVLAVLKSRIIDKILDKKPLVYLGKISFAIYLVHITVIYLVCIPIFNFLLEKSYTFASSAILSSIISFIFILGISSIYSKYIDDISIRFSNNLARIFIKKSS